MEHDKGQSLVEFSFTLVFMLLLLVGIVEFGILLFQYVQIRDAAQEGALYGSVYPFDTVSIEQRVRSTSSTPINLTNPEVEVKISFKNGKACEGDELRVVVQYPHKIFMPLLSQILGDDVIMLNGEAIDTVLVPVCS